MMLGVHLVIVNLFPKTNLTFDILVHKSIEIDSEQFWSDQNVRLYLANHSLYLNQILADKRAFHFWTKFGTSVHSVPFDVDFNF